MAQCPLNSGGIRNAAGGPEMPTSRNDASNSKCDPALPWIGYRNGKIDLRQLHTICVRLS